MFKNEDVVFLVIVEVRLKALLQQELKTPTGAVWTHKNTHRYAVVQSQKAATAHISSTHLQPFGFTDMYLYACVSTSACMDT